MRLRCHGKLLREWGELACLNCGRAPGYPDPPVLAEDTRTVCALPGCTIVAKPDTLWCHKHPDGERRSHASRGAWGELVRER